MRQLDDARKLLLFLCREISQSKQEVAPMPKYICQACGVQHAETASPPPRCIICEDPRQFVPEEGQRWTTLEQLQSRHTNLFRPVADGLTAISTDPHLSLIHI